MSIDYGRGQTNIDNTTGIRYGVISTNSLPGWFWDSVDHDYGPPTCPKCGNASDVADESDLTDEEREEDYSYKPRSCPDFACKSCKYLFGSDDAYPEEAIGWSIGERATDLSDGSPNPDMSDLLAVNCLDSDCMIIRSKYYTYANFCSPCIPGAGNLDSLPDFGWNPYNSGGGFVAILEPSGGVKTYCFEHFWFEPDACPYPIWRVSDNTLVYVPRHLRNLSLRIPGKPAEDDLDSMIEVLLIPPSPPTDGEEQDSESGEDKPCPPAPSTCQISLEFQNLAEAESLLDWLHACGVDGSFDRHDENVPKFSSACFRLSIVRLEGHNKSYRGHSRDFRVIPSDATSSSVTHGPLLTVGGTEDLLDKRRPDPPVAPPTTKNG